MESSHKDIHTERLIITPFSQEHLTTRYVGWLNDPEVVRYSDQRFRQHTLESCTEFFKSFEGSNNHFWAIINTDKDLGHIGNITAYVDKHNQIADLGILIGEKSAWEQGYGVEAWFAVCQHLFKTTNLRKIIAGTTEVNQGMLGIMHRTGMKEEGRRRHQALIDNKPVDHIYTAFFREDFIK